MAGGGSSESHSTDMTPQAFQGLQGPYASVIGNMLGFQLRNQNGLVNPVNFGYPAGQTAIGQGVPSGGMSGGFGGNGNSPNDAWQNRQSFSPNTSNSPDFYNQNNGANQNRGMGGNTNPLAGMYLSNPNLGTGNPNDVLNGIPRYQGPLTAGMTGSEGMQLGQLNGNAYGLGGLTNNMTDAYLTGQMAGNYLPGANPTLNSFSQNYQGAQPGFSPTLMNPFLNSAITAAQTPTMQNLQETLGQNLPSQFAMAGQRVQPGGSSAFDRAGDIAIRGATQEMGNIASTLSNQFYGTQQQQAGQNVLNNNQNTNQAMQQELGQEFQGGQAAQNRQLTAAQTAPTATSSQVSNMVQNLQAQALPRLIQQYGIENGMSQFNNQMNSLLGLLGIAGGVTKPTVGQSSSSEQKPNLLPLAGI